MPNNKFVHDRVVPKLCGADVELGNFFVGGAPDEWRNSPGDAARALLAEIPGFSRKPASYYYASFPHYDSWRRAYGETDVQDHDASAIGQSSGYHENAQDHGRKFLASNGSCVYIDMDFLEICLPIVSSAFDHVAAFGAMLRIVREAMNRANERLSGRTIKVLVNNTGGNGTSHGSHLNFLTTSECWNNIFERRVHYLLFLASYQCASIVLTGAGKVGSDLGRDPGRYQISARAEYFEILTGPHTTFHRPICNARQENCCGDEPLSRVHSIFFDSTLCHGSSLLKVGMTQIILAMIEQEQVPPLLLEDPVEGLHRYSRDPDLKAKNRLIDGRAYTAVELLEAIYDQAKRFVDAGRADGLVKDVGRIMQFWGECLEKLRQRDFAYLSRRIDWVAKLALLNRTAAARRLTWDSPGMKYLDHMYSSLDSREGLYWALERGNAVEKIVPDGQIERFVHEPPDDTRAWLRSYILKHAEPGMVEDVDWDMLRFNLGASSPAGRYVDTHPTLWMSNPLRFTRQECEHVLKAAPSLIDGLRALGLGRDKGAAPVNERATEFETSPAVSGKPFTGV